MYWTWFSHQSNVDGLVCLVHVSTQEDDNLNWCPNNIMMIDMNRFVLYFFVVLAFFFWVIRLIYSSHLYNIYIYLVRLSPTNYTLISSIIHSIDRSIDRSIVFPHLGWLPMCVWVCDCLLHLNQLVTKDENRWTNETRVQRSNYSIPNDAFDVQMYNKWT